MRESENGTQIAYSRCGDHDSCNRRIVCNPALANLGELKMKLIPMLRETKIYATNMMLTIVQYDSYGVEQVFTIPCALFETIVDTVRQEIADYGSSVNCDAVKKEN
jgi:hypothetical protein